MLSVAKTCDEEQSCSEMPRSTQTGEQNTPKELGRKATSLPGLAVKQVHKGLRKVLHILGWAQVKNTSLTFEACNPISFPGFLTLEE